jgi:hypothetical protein
MMLSVPLSHSFGISLGWMCLSLCLACGARAEPPVSTTKNVANVPATLRLAQVVPRLPTIYFYALAQDESGSALQPQPGAVSASFGSSNLSLEPGSDKGIGIVFLIDISGSLSPGQFGIIQGSVRSWIQDLGPYDKAAIVTFGSAVNMRQDFTNQKNDLIKILDNLKSNDQQTLLYQGLVQTIDLSRRLDKDIPLRRAIVVLTDGLDDQQGGAGRQEVVDKLTVDPIPIYGIGASRVNDAKVDAALKDFASLVRLSGGDFRRVADPRTLDKGYSELRHIVGSTRPFVAKCEDPPCTPDGSRAVVRLLLSQGSSRLSSQLVTVSEVAEDGKPKPTILPPPVPPPIATPVPWYKQVINIFLAAPLRWSIILAVLLAAIIGGIVAWVMKPWRREKPAATPTSMKVTTQEPLNLDVPEGGFTISGRVAIRSGTQRDRQRLRLFPIGRNDIGPWDLDFQGDTKVGRAPVPEMDISIYNDGQISAHHCTLSANGKSILVRDEGSTNGTRVNGVPINGFMHAEPDSILGVGRTELRMKLLPAGAQ